MRLRAEQTLDSGAARRPVPPAAAALPFLFAVAVGWGGAVLALVWHLRLTAWEGRAEVPWQLPALTLAGLLLGGWLGGRVRGTPLGRPARWTAQAGLLLCLGVVATVAADLVVAPGRQATAGMLAWALGVPAACWGAAVVRVLQAWGGSVRSPLLLACLLLGAGIAFRAGPGYLAAEGLEVGQRQAGAAVLAAAFLLLVLPPAWSRAQLQAPDPNAPRPAGAVAAGFLFALVWCWLVPRVDLLWGFQGGALRMQAAVLLSAAFGCAALAPLLRRMWGDGAPAWSALLAAAFLAIGLHEHLAPGNFAPGYQAASALPVSASGGAGGWRRAVALAVPAALVGALPGLVLGRRRLSPGAVRRAAFGGILGFAAGHVALLQAVPSAFGDRSVQVVAVAAPPLAALLLVRATALAVPAAILLAGWGLLGLGGQPSPWRGGPVVPEWAGARRLVSTVQGAQVEYERSRQELVLRAGRRALDFWGPEARGALLAGHLPGLLRPSSQRTLLLGLGNGRAAAALEKAQSPEVFEPRSGIARLAAALAADGPVPVSEAVLPRDLKSDGLRVALNAREPGSVDVLVCAAPVSAAEAWLATSDFHRLARHVLGDGLLIRYGYVPRTPADLLECELTAASRAHPYLTVLLVRDTVVLLGSGKPLPATRAAWEEVFRGASSESTKELHRAGVAGGRDLARAVLFQITGRALPGVCWSDDDLAVALLLEEPDECLRTGSRASWSVLSAALVAADGGDTARQRLQLRTAQGEVLESLLVSWAAQRRGAPDSLLFYEDERAARLRLDVATVTALLGPDVPGGGPLAAALSAKWRTRGCPHPVLQAALGLADRRGTRLLEAELAGAYAVALDPTFFERAPARLAELAPPAPRVSPLEDLGRLPDSEALATLAASADPLGVALRARFAVECAQALVGELERRGLTASERSTLAQVLDPASLRSAVRAATATGRVAEVLAAWRADLSMPANLEAVLRGPATLRQALAAALAGRGDGRSIDSLARLLTDDEPEVRIAAGAALFRTVGDRIPFDPEWPESRLRQAADRLKALHNRKP